MRRSQAAVAAIIAAVLLLGSLVLTKPSIAGEKARDGRFIAYDNGTVLDTSTNLIWAAKDNGNNINWTNAQTYCNNYRGGGYTDWRMPTRDQLAGLMDGRKPRQAACHKAYKLYIATSLIDVTCMSVWASDKSGHYATGFNFAKGERILSRESNDSNFRVLPVRSNIAAPDPKVQGQVSGGAFMSPTLGAKFVQIPAGTFTMGSPQGEVGASRSETQHRVTISQPFYMQATEVTQGQWRRVMGDNPSHFSKCGDDCPVDSVSWMDVEGFIRKLNQMEGTDKYRLPTEAQWEYAARAGTQTRFNSGENILRSAWYYHNSGGKTHPVGQKTPNAWGLYDMHGNVREWVRDWYANYPSEGVTDPEGPALNAVRPDRDRRIYRGGGYSCNERDCRSARRNYTTSTSRLNNLGFRLVRIR